MHRCLAIIDLEAQVKRLSVYCPAGLKLKADLLFEWGPDTVRIWMTDGFTEVVLPDDEALEHTDAEILALLRRHGFPLYSDAEYTALTEKIADERKRRHVEQVRANNQRISQKRAADRQRYHSQCWVCRTPIAANRGSKRYCSPRCRQAGHRMSKNDPEFKYRWNHEAAK
jgi:hypothetical protein